MRRRTAGRERLTQVRGVPLASVAPADGTPQRDGRSCPSRLKSGNRGRQLGPVPLSKGTPTLASVAPAGVGSLRGWRAKSATPSRTLQGVKRLRAFDLAGEWKKRLDGELTIA